MQITEQIVKTLLALPTDRQAEVLDFVEFLAQRAPLAGTSEPPSTFDHQQAQ